MAKHAGNFNDTIISFDKSKQIANPQNIKKTLFFSTEMRVLPEVMLIPGVINVD